MVNTQILVLAMRQVGAKLSPAACSCCCQQSQLYWTLQDTGVSIVHLQLLQLYPPASFHGLLAAHCYVQP